MYKVLVQPVLIYASETWPLMKCNEKQLCAFEKKNLEKYLMAQWKRMEYGGKDTIMNFIVSLRSRILSNLLRPGGWTCTAC